MLKWTPVPVDQIKLSNTEGVSTMHPIYRTGYYAVIEMDLDQSYDDDEHNWFIIEVPCPDCNYLKRDHFGIPKGHDSMVLGCEECSEFIVRVKGIISKRWSVEVWA